MCRFRGPTGSPFWHQGGRADGGLFLGGLLQAVGPSTLGLLNLFKACLSARLVC